jgi:hypothetical protein
MVLTSTTILDVVNQIQSITFYESAAQIDQITYQSNMLTFSAISTFNLVKSDFLLYFQYLNTFFNLLTVNFPAFQSQANYIWPLCEFDITSTNVGVFKIIYTQNSLSNNVYTINYVPIATSCSFTARASPITISVQEFFMTLNMLTQFTNQVRLN